MTPTCPVRATQDGLKVHQLAQGEVSNLRPSRNLRKDSVLDIIHKEHSSPYKQFNGPVTHKPPLVTLAVTGCGHSPNSKDDNASVLKPLSAQGAALRPMTAQESFTPQCGTRLHHHRHHLVPWMHSLGTGRLAAG